MCISVDKFGQIIWINATKSGRKSINRFHKVPFSAVSQKGNGFTKSWISRTGNAGNSISLAFVFAYSYVSFQSLVTTELGAKLHDWVNVFCCRAQVCTCVLVDVCGCTVSVFTWEGTWVHVYLHLLVFLEMQKLENIWRPIPPLAESSFPS